MRPGALMLLLACLTVAIAGCGGRTDIVRVQVPVSGTQARTGQAGQKLGFPALATKNTTRVAGGDPVADAAAVALAVYPSAAPGTHPAAVVIAPTDSWEAALAASVFMATPLRAPLLLSGPNSLPSATSSALGALAPTGASQLQGAQVITVGDAAGTASLHATSVSGQDPFTLAAGIDRLEAQVTGRRSSAIVIASADQPAFAMPAAGWAAESGNPILFVSGNTIPPATVAAIQAHGHPSIYVLGPSSVISDDIVKALGRYGPTKRVGDTDPASNSVAFAAYRDPACPVNQPCVHIPGSFGWALRSPGHGYTLINANRTLDAAASAALSASGSYGPQLLTTSATSLPSSILNYFLDYATPAYTQEGPTAAVYNHGWVMGDATSISVGIQAEMDSLLEVVPQK